ncbi:MAG TPA: sulfite exporter TauE/SafE family protein, partial [Deltaproteobacteria bacterium]|nr:sulfite exporter TauE/SafE family protein [Deltaproteobacteria bacterium]
MVRAVVEEERGARPRARPRWLFWLWLLLFYVSWAAFVFGQGRWATVAAHWPISLAMLFGSYVGGSTPMGGGSVAFPILVLLLGEPARLGREFSFAVQSLGLGSATVYMLLSGRPLAWGVLRWAILGSAV